MKCLLTNILTIRNICDFSIMVIYKDFTLREIQGSISNEHTKLSSSMTEDAVIWLHEALKLHTSRDGSCRDRQEIGKRISRQHL